MSCCNVIILIISCLCGMACGLIKIAINMFVCNLLMIKI